MSLRRETSKSVWAGGTAPGNQRMKRGMLQIPQRILMTRSLKYYLQKISDDNDDDDDSADDDDDNATMTTTFVRLFFDKNTSRCCDFLV